VNFRGAAGQGPAGQGEAKRDQTAIVSGIFQRNKVTTTK
jgi:hypothetical protein